MTSFRLPSLPCAWSLGHEEPVLGPSDVHVWKVDLRAGASMLRELEACLNEKERHRADRLRVSSVRRRFIARRTALRFILGGYTSTEPGEVALLEGEGRKPALAGAGADLACNLTASGDLALIAVARQMAIGIDLERLDPEIDVVGVSRRFFHEAAARAIAGADRKIRHLLFYRCWTRIEALAKAMGVGLNGSIPDLSAAACYFDPVAGSSLIDWRIDSFEPGPQHIAAIAIPPVKASFSFFDWHWPLTNAVGRPWNYLPSDDSAAGESERPKRELG